MNIDRDTIARTTDSFRIFKPEDNPFKSIIADVTHRCNMKCANCYVPNRRIPDMDRDRFLDLVARLPHRTTIRLMGAEATVRRDLPDLVRGVRALGHRLVLVTNGLKLASHSYCFSLHRAGLRLVGISMNAADEDDTYCLIDKGVYARRKRAALVNCFRLRMFVGTSMIVAKGINEHLITRQVALFFDAAREAGVDLLRDRPYRNAPMVLRFKSIGLLGRYMKDRSIDFDELVALVCDRLGMKNGPPEDLQLVQSGVHKIEDQDETDCIMPSVAFRLDRDDGSVVIKILNWSADEEGIVDPNNMNRGRITQDFMLAPAMEHIKANEFGY